MADRGMAGRDRSAMPGGPTAQARALAWLVLLAAFSMPVPAATRVQGGDSWIPALDLEARDLEVRVGDRSRGSETTIAGRMLLQGSREIYVGSADAAAIFKAGRYWQGSTRSLTFRVGDQAFQLTADSRLVAYEDRETLLPVPVLMIDGDLWLPMEFLVRVLGPALRETVHFNPVDRVLTLGSASFNVSGLQVENLTRATAVHVLCEVPLSYRAEAAESGLVILKIYGGEADPGRLTAGRSGLVQGVTCRQFADHLMVYLRVDELVSRFRSYTRREGREIVVVLEEEQFSALPEPTPRGPVNVVVEGETPPAAGPGIDLRTVVIDPGHGGANLGAQGPGGLAEKDVNLAVARELARLLRREDLEVVLTREEDVQVDLTERAEIANRSDGDLFLSLHCNGFFDEAARGVETYFLSPASSDWDASVAMAENADPGADDDEVSFIVWDLVQNQFISSSSNLAEVVQATLSRELGLPNRGVRQAGFRVLVGAYMPAVLVEMGFLTNPAEERALGDPAYRQRLARALAAAVLAYRERHQYGGAAGALPGQEE